MLYSNLNIDKPQCQSVERPMPTQPMTAVCLSSEPVMPCLQSISATPGFSAFTPVKEPVYVRSQLPQANSTKSQPPLANCNKSPHKASYVVSHVNFWFFVASLKCFNFTWLNVCDLNVCFFSIIILIDCICCFHLPYWTFATICLIYFILGWWQTMVLECSKRYNNFNSC